MNPDQAALELRIGEALRRLRRRRHLTVAEVAHGMGEGPSFSTEISRWERGERSIRVSRTLAYLSAIDASLTDLEHALHQQELSREWGRPMRPSDG